jgi:hypothetical protein
VYQLLASLRALLTGAGKLEEELAHVVQHVLSILGVVAGLPWIAHINVSKQNVCYFLEKKGLRIPIRDPGWVKKKRIRIRDEQPGSYFRELKRQFFGLKYLNSLVWIRDGKKLSPGSGMEKSWIRDPG